MAVEGIAVAKLKEFKFRVEVNGYPAANVQEFDPGDREISVVESAGAGQNFPVKEAGMMKYGPAILKNVIPVEGSGKTHFDKLMNLAQDALSGNGSPPQSYWFNFTMYELDNSGNPMRAFEFFQAFVTKIKAGNRSATAADKNAIEEIEISYSSRVVREINAAS